jgi:hypothetical protein
VGVEKLVTRKIAKIEMGVTPQVPIVLLGRRELFRVVRLRLAGTEGLRNGEQKDLLFLQLQRRLYRLFDLVLGRILMG